MVSIFNQVKMIFSWQQSISMWLLWIGFNSFIPVPIIAFIFHLTMINWKALVWGLVLLVTGPPLGIVILINGT